MRSRHHAAQANRHETSGLPTTAHAPHTLTLPQEPTHEVEHLRQLDRLGLVGPDSNHLSLDEAIDDPPRHVRIPAHSHP